MRSIVRSAVPATGPATATEATIWANLARYDEAAHGAFAANTERAIKADVKVFTRWCGQEGHQALPASGETVRRFVDAMAADKAPASVRRYVSSIACFHRAAELANPCEAQAVKLALKRMHNEKGRDQKQAAPLNEMLVRKLVDVRDGRLCDLRNRAILVVGYVTLARRGELVALQLSDLKVEADGFGTIRIRRSKTDQEGLGATVPIPADAMAHLLKWTTAARIADGALFRAVRYSGSIGSALDPGAVSRIFKTLAHRAGLPADKVAALSGHSTRVGGAVDMLRYKETLAAIMVSGRWKSPEMVGRYVKEEAARDSAASRIAAVRAPF